MIEKGGSFGEKASPRKEEEVQNLTELAGVGGQEAN